MKKEMVEELTLSIGETIPLLFNRMDFLQLVQAICYKLDSDRSLVAKDLDGIRVPVKLADRILAQAQMIPLRFIPIDSREGYSTSGEMYDFAIAFCEYYYSVADGTIDDSKMLWRAGGYDLYLVKYLEYSRFG